VTALVWHRVRVSQRTVRLPSGEEIPALGMGTWGYAEDSQRTPDEIAALQTGIDLGMTLVDTAEMYADGGAEALVGKALTGRRDEVFLVTKVLPRNASRADTPKACERSLRRLETDHVDLYLLHWRGPYRLEETVSAFIDLQTAGKIRYWGVSNFDAPDVEELLEVQGGEQVTTDQVVYNLVRRGIEYDLVPLCLRLGIPIMAYSPLERGLLVNHPVLSAAAQMHNATPAQVALAWVLAHDNVCTIPKASNLEHVREDHDALRIRLSDDELAILDEAFPQPRTKVPLEMH
jgi:diketogulonate reductase-like aldo/keto reductase